MESVENESETRSNTSSIDYPKEKVNGKPPPSERSSKKLGLYDPYDLYTVIP